MLQEHFANIPIKLWKSSLNILNAYHFEINMRMLQTGNVFQYSLIILKQAVIVTKSKSHKCLTTFYFLSEKKINKFNERCIHTIFFCVNALRTLLKTRLLWTNVILMYKIMDTWTSDLSYFVAFSCITVLKIYLKSFLFYSFLFILKT